jgi:hypothetical protein
MILIIVPAAWLAALFLGLTMCRLAALSDYSQAVALAEWMASNRTQERASGLLDRTSEPLPADPGRGAYRATG